jgi:hypothetical protein
MLSIELYQSWQGFISVSFVHEAKVVNEIVYVLALRSLTQLRVHKLGKWAVVTER